MKITSILCRILVGLWVLAATGCNQEIEQQLPVYEPKMVLEFYLEDNKPLRCLLQESINYTDRAAYQLINDATVVLSHNGIKDTLFNKPYAEPKFEKIYNYYNPKTIRLLPNVEYEVYIKDKKGREMTGKTRLINVVPIDSLVYKFNAKKKATAGLIFNDPAGSTDYYRLLAFKNMPVVKDTSTWDIRFDDLPFNGKQFSFYTGYSYEKGDTVIGRLYRLTPEHQHFSQSVSDAQSSNGNPFGQPAAIRSNVTGGLGIFTTLTFDEKTLIVK